MAHLFVSHANRDQPLVNELLDLLQLGTGVPREHLFYTSGAATGVPAGRGFHEYIRQQVSEASLVLAIVTPHFQESPFCLAEVGAAWARQDTLFPLAIPGLDREHLGGVLEGVQIRYLDDPEALAELHDAICKALDLPSSAEAWERQKARFLSRVSALSQEVRADFPPPSEAPATQPAQSPGTELLMHSGAPALFTFDDPGVPKFDDFVQGCHTVKILSRTAVNLLGHYERSLRELMRDGCSVQLAMVDPLSPAASHVYADSEGIYRRNYEATAAHLARLADFRSNGQLEIRRSQDAPSFSLVIAQREPRTESAMNVQLNMLYSRIGRDRPVIRLIGDDRWFDSFATEFSEIWTRAREWEDD